MGTTEAVARLERDLERLRHDRDDTVAQYNELWHRVERLGDQIAATQQDIEAIENALGAP